MKSWVLSYLRCPQCQSDLVLESFPAPESAGAAEGVLICQSERCRVWYPIVRGIPRLLPETLRVELTREFVAEHRGELESLGLEPALVESVSTVSMTDTLLTLKQHTIVNFGFEWTEYGRFGWDDPVFTIDHEERIFNYKSLVKPEEFKGSLVLDAGCGNGRYSYWAAHYGGQVIGLDLGDGVESAAANMANLPNVQIIQGDILNLPLADQTFDIIFSIGVLMHTGDAEKATTVLSRKVKAGGSITVHLYGKGNLLYEIVDASLRRWTTRMAIGDLQRLTRGLYQATRFLQRARLLGIVGRFVRLEPHPHCIFDWYAAPIATHHTYPEVRRWFARLGLPVIATNEDRSGWRSWLKKAVHPGVGRPTVVTVRARAVY